MAIESRTHRAAILPDSTIIFLLSRGWWKIVDDTYTGKVYRLLEGKYKAIPFSLDEALYECPIEFKDTLLYNLDFMTEHCNIKKYDTFSGS